MPGTRTTWLGIVAAAAVVCVTTGCPRREGPMERAGEKVDRAADRVEDTFDPPGPAEKAGRKIDRAVDDLDD